MNFLKGQKSRGWGQRTQLAYGKNYSLENTVIVSQGNLNKILLEVWMVEKCKKYCAEVRVREMSPNMICADCLEVSVSANSGLG